MSIIYTFKVNQLEIVPSVDGLTDVVTRVRYNYNGVNETGISGSFAGVTPMPAPADTKNFVQLKDLKEQDVINWLELVADKPHMQQQIQKQINNQVLPKNVSVPNPWDPLPSTKTPN